MGNRRLRKAIRSLRVRIEEHKAKIREELLRPDPNLALIAHWEGEIRAFEERVHRLEARLARRLKRGR